MLIDPDDVAAGHVVRFRRAAPEKIVRSRVPAHPTIVSVETFTETQLLRRSRAAGGLESRRKLERASATVKHAYVLRGAVRCGYCARKMEGTPKHGREYYRCVTRRMAPGSPVLETHPTNVYLQERAVLSGLNAWLGELFDRDHRDQTVAALLAAQTGTDGGEEAACRDAAKLRLTDAETRLSRLRRAIEAGAEPEALIESLNAAQAQRTAAHAELSVLKDVPALLTDADVYALLDELGDVGAALSRANPEKMRRLYESLRVEMVYDHDARAVDVTVRPLGGPVLVSEGGRQHYLHGKGTHSPVIVCWQALRDPCAFVTLMHPARLSARRACSELPDGTPPRTPRRPAYRRLTWHDASHRHDASQPACHTVIS